MHFMWADLIDNPFVAAMGMQLTKIDRLHSGLQASRRQDLPDANMQ